MYFVFRMCVPSSTSSSTMPKMLPGSVMGSTDASAQPAAYTPMIRHNWASSSKPCLTERCRRCLGVSAPWNISSCVSFRSPLTEATNSLKCAQILRAQHLTLAASLFDFMMCGTTPCLILGMDTVCLGFHTRALARHFKNLPGNPRDRHKPCGGTSQNPGMRKGAMGIGSHRPLEKLADRLSGSRR